MKNKLNKLIAIVVLALGLNVQAQTNEVSTGKSESGGYEITLGGGGIEAAGVTQFAVDFSLSTNPLDFAPNVWFGVCQSLSFDPKFAGSTDLNINLSTHVYKELYVNTGWSGGIVYDDYGSDEIWRTGPEVTLQYYVGDNAFIYSGLNYDLEINENDEGGFRYSFGVGLSF